MIPIQKQCLEVFIFSRELFSVCLPVWRCPAGIPEKEKYFPDDSCWCAVSNGGSKPFEKFMKGE